MDKRYQCDSLRSGYVVILRLSILAGADTNDGRILLDPKRRSWFNKRVVSGRPGKQAMAGSRAEYVFALPASSFLSRFGSEIKVVYLDPMRDFSNAQSAWYPTWPSNVEDRAMIVYVPLYSVLVRHSWLLTG